MAPRPQRSSQHALLVEGTNDKFVAIHIWKHHYASEPPFLVYDKHSGQEEEVDSASEGASGVDALLSSISSRIKEGGRKSLGIIADANGDASKRWSQISQELRQAGVDPPQELAFSGAVITPIGRGPIIGVWVMPDNGSQGELEDFVVSMIPHGDLIWPLAIKYIENIVEQVPKERRALNDHKTTKAMVHSWLAARSEPRPMGRAIEAGDLQVDGDLCKRFAEWLRAVFESQ